MVITNIIGGLGNQMFQYAAGRAVSIKNDLPLKLDISSFSNYALHQGFELDRVFDCNAVVASKRDFHSVLGFQSWACVRRIILRPSMAAFCCKEFVIEPHFNYWSGINDQAGSCYLYGYWQSEKYFANLSEQIRKDFTFKYSIENLNAELLKQINQVNAVSLHVRRGDYVSNPETTATHGLCSLDYYMEAIKYIAERISAPHFFVFSDDIDWVKNSLKIEFPHQYVDHNHGAESYNDMRLMSLCKHHIIANSSFSWWGAWLNQSTSKIVIAPKKWFAHSADVKDLLPKNWVKL